MQVRKDESRKNRNFLVYSEGIEKDTTNLYLRTYKVRFTHGEGVGAFAPQATSL